MEQSNPGDTVDQRLKVLDPLMVWAQLLGSNLRLFRRRGTTPVWLQTPNHADERLKKICEANGWPPPPTTIPGLKALNNAPQFVRPAVHRKWNADRHSLWPHRYRAAMA